MAELAALALRALGAGSVPAQDAAREAGALPLVAALLKPAGNKAMAEERKARKDNAAAAASRAVHALAEGNTASKVNAFPFFHSTPIISHEYLFSRALEPGGKPWYGRGPQGTQGRCGRRGVTRRACSCQGPLCLDSFTMSPCKGA